MSDRTPKRSFSYARELASAGFEGAADARGAKVRLFTPGSAMLFAAPVALGTAAGAFRTHWFGKRKAPSAMALGGLLGGVVGCGAALAWASRGWMAPATRGAARRVNAVRDAHWLAANPINYA